jgi:hypothetical protein
MVRIPLAWRLAGLMVLIMLASGCSGDAMPKPSASSSAISAATTEGRIAAAEQAGRITAATALLYRVYALYGDPALPAEYRTPVLGISDSSVMGAAAAQIDTLPADVAARLAPFLRPPGYDDSWWALRRGTPGPPAARAEPSSGPFNCRRIDPAVWSYVDAVNSVRVWAPLADRELVAAATAIRDEIDRHIYDTVTGYFAKEPLPDSGPCAAGSDRLDIWVVHTLASGSWGLTTPFGDLVSQTDTSEQPVYIEVAADVQELGLPLFPVVAHELSHAVTNARPLAEHIDEYKWLNEATAEWTARLTYPDVDREYTDLITDPGAPLDLRTSRSHHYSDYLFLAYLSETVGKESVRRIWENAAGADSLGAIDTTVGGFRKVWPGFARARWNQPPVVSFTAWDNVSDTPALATDKTVSLNTRSTVSLPVSQMAHLASNYHRIVVTNAAAGWGVVVQNGTSDNPDAATHLFVKAAGQWREESLTGTATKLICDAGLEELVVAISNSAMETRLNDSGTAVTVDRCSTALPMAVRLTPPSVIGGTNIQGVVELNRVNDDGWLQIALTSSDPAVTVPPVVVVAPGQKEAPFTATTRPVAAQTYAKITASNPAVPASSTAYSWSGVAPPCPKFIGLPGRIAAGADFKGTVALTGPAPPGGLTVSSQPWRLIVPATITIPAGETSVTFNGQGGDPGCGATSCERTGQLTVSANGCIPVAFTVVFQ